MIATSDASSPTSTSPHSVDRKLSFMTLIGESKPVLVKFERDAWLVTFLHTLFVVGVKAVSCLKALISKNVLIRLFLVTSSHTPWVVETNLNRFKILNFYIIAEFHISFMLSSLLYAWSTIGWVTECLWHVQINPLNSNSPKDSCGNSSHGINYQSAWTPFPRQVATRVFASVPFCQAAVESDRLLSGSFTG